MANTFLIKKIALTEKASVLQGQNKYVFMVNLRATKPEVKKAVETLYGVKVSDVNMVRYFGKASTYRGRKGKKPEVKKAVVTLKKGEKIDTAVTK